MPQRHLIIKDWGEAPGDCSASQMTRAQISVIGCPDVPHEHLNRVFWAVRLGFPLRLVDNWVL